MKSISIFEECIDRFKEKVLPEEYTGRCTLLSEAFFICALANKARINVLIDSGTFLGRSAEIFAKYGFRLVYTVDYNLRDKAVHRLKKYSNIAMIQGMDRDVLPNLLALHRTDNVGLFLDSTKGMSACKFATELAANYSNLKFLALHDQWKHHFFKRIVRNPIFSDEEPFFSKYWHLSKTDIENPAFIERYESAIEKMELSRTSTFKGFVVGATIL